MGPINCAPNPHRLLFMNNGKKRLSIDHFRKKNRYLQTYDDHHHHWQNCSIFGLGTRSVGLDTLGTE